MASHWKAVEDISWDLGSYPITSIKSIPFAYRGAFRQIDNMIVQSTLRAKYPLVWKLHFLLPAMLLDPNSTLNSLEARFKAFREQLESAAPTPQSPGERRFYKDTTRQDDSKLREKRCTSLLRKRADLEGVRSFGVGLQTGIRLRTRHSGSSSGETPRQNGRHPSQPICRLEMQADATPCRFDVGVESAAIKKAKTRNCTRTGRLAVRTLRSTGCRRWKLVHG